MSTNAVSALIETIRVKAASQGFYLYRYQTNYGLYATNIKYALHSSPERPDRSGDCDGWSVSMSQREGSTTRCEAFRKLSAMLARIS